MRARPRCLHAVETVKQLVHIVFRRGWRLVVYSQLRETLGVLQINAYLAGPIGISKGVLKQVIHDLANLHSVAGNPHLRRQIMLQLYLFRPSFEGIVSAACFTRDGRSSCSSDDVSSASRP